MAPLHPWPQLRHVLSNRCSHRWPLQRWERIAQVKVEKGDGLAFDASSGVLKAPAQMHQGISAAGQGNSTLTVCEEQLLQVVAMIGG